MKKLLACLLPLCLLAAMLCGCTSTGETPSAAPASAPAPSASAPASSLPVPESSLPVPESTEAPAATEPVVEVPEDLHPMLFRVTGEGGQDEFVYYKNTQLAPRAMIDPATKIPTLDKPLFDLKVTAQKASEYSKMAQNELALQLYQQGFFAPNNADPALAALNMMDFDGREDVIKTVEQNGTLFQMLQMIQAENMALKAQLGLPVMPAEGGAPAGQPAAAPSAKLPQGDAQGAIATPNRITDNAKARAQAATQPR
jgi:hypothetical protein